MMITENVVSFYDERRAAANWAEWSETNPGKASILAQASIEWDSRNGGDSPDNN